MPLRRREETHRVNMITSSAFLHVGWTRSTWEAGRGWWTSRTGESIRNSSSIVRLCFTQERNIVRLHGSCVWTSHAIQTCIDIQSQYEESRSKGNLTNFSVNDLFHFEFFYQFFFVFYRVFLVLVVIQDLKANLVSGWVIYLKQKY